PTPGGPTPTPGGPTPTPTPGGTPSVPVAPIRASALVLGDDPKPPITLNARNFRLRSAPHKGSPSGVTVPSFFSKGDPTLLGSTGGGATLTVYNPNGGQKVVLQLPASKWLAGGTFARPTFRYRDPKRASGPITSVVLANGRLAITGKGDGLYSLAN